MSSRISLGFCTADKDQSDLRCRTRVSFFLFCSRYLSHTVPLSFRCLLSSMVPGCDVRSMPFIYRLIKRQCSALCTMAPPPTTYKHGTRCAPAVPNLSTDVVLHPVPAFRCYCSSSTEVPNQPSLLLVSPGRPLVAQSFFIHVCVCYLHRIIFFLSRARGWVVFVCLCVCAYTQAFIPE